MSIGVLRFVFEYNDQPTAIFTIMVVVWYSSVRSQLDSTASMSTVCSLSYWLLLFNRVDIRSALHGLTNKRSQRYLILKCDWILTQLFLKMWLNVALPQESALSAAILPLNNRERDSRSGNTSRFGGELIFAKTLKNEPIWDSPKWANSEESLKGVAFENFRPSLAQIIIYFLFNLILRSLNFHRSLNVRTRYREYW